MDKQDLLQQWEIFQWWSWWSYLCKPIVSVQVWTWHCFRSERKLDLDEDELRSTIKTVTHKPISHCFQWWCHEHHPGKCNTFTKEWHKLHVRGMGWGEEEGHNLEITIIVKSLMRDKLIVKVEMCSLHWDWVAVSSVEQLNRFQAL